jgi:carboxypeptidase C (cathepsin A)
MRLFPRVCCCLLWAGVLLTGPVLGAVQPGPIASVSSPRAIAIRGATVSYDASFSQLVLPSPAGVPQATISALSYVRSGANQSQERPVLFAWGGGPAGASWEVCFLLLCPKLLAGSDAGATRAFVDNPGTLLDVADIVIIDAVGTGFSRELAKDGGKPYWGVVGDAQAVEALIRQWLQTHGRPAAPVYLLGVSYGGFRLGEVAKHVGDLDVAGLIALSGGLNLALQAGDLSSISSDPAWIGGIGIDQSFIVNLPTMAAAAFVHHKVDPQGKSVEQFYEQVREFALGDYAIALQQGSALTAATRDLIATRMSRMIGLPARDIAAANLRVQSQTFLEKLIPDSIVSRLDTRVAAPAPKAPSIPGRIRSADDPTLDMAGRNISTSKWVRDYLLNDIGVKTDLEYVTLNLDVNSGWDWSPGTGALEANIVGLDNTPSIAGLMRQKPRTRLFIAAAYFDLAVPALAQQYAVLHSSVPLDRTTMALYKGGHEIFEDEGSRKQLQAQLHLFITGSSAH